MNKITTAYVHLRKIDDGFGVFGISTTKGKDTNWFLFKDEDKDPAKHSFVAEKWKSQRKTPSQYRNVLVQNEALKLYLNDDETAFSFGGVLLEKDEENSIKEKGKNRFLFVSFKVQLSIEI